MNAVLNDAVEHWKYIDPLFRRPANDEEFDRLVSHLDELLDIVGSDEQHPLASLVKVLGTLVAEYEAEHVGEPSATGTDALKELMAMHQLRQSDLPEIGPQGVVSEVLNGKRELNVRQIKALAKRFNVTPETFID
jgi:HTH-type transcriptional regulator/antitoxin HigA